MTSNFLTTRQLAQELGRSENSIRFHIKKGRIKPTLKLGRIRLFTMEDVLRQLKKYT